MQLAPALIIFSVAGLSVWHSAAALNVQEPEVRQFIATVARNDGFKTKRLRHLFRQVQIKQSIIDAANRPAERVLTWSEYRGQFVNDSRILPGVEFLRAHPAAIAKASAEGVPSFVLLGILGAETRFGRQTGRYRVIDALATRAFGMPTRAEFFRDELEQFLLLTREESLDPLQVRGSYSGAMGAAQFMPSSYRKFAVDENHDGRRDLWESWDDVLGSIANFLLNHGWRVAQPVVIPAQLPSGNLEPFDLSALALNETVASLRSKGVQFDTPSAEDTPALLIVVQGPEGPEYRVGFNNFYVITRYNRSILYALAVHDLGRAIEDAAQEAVVSK